MQSMMEAAADAGKASLQEKVKKRKKSREPTEKEMGRERKEEALNQKATAWQAGFAAGGLDGGDVNRDKTGQSQIYLTCHRISSSKSQCPLLKSRCQSLVFKVATHLNRSLDVELLPSMSQHDFSHGRNINEPKPHIERSDFPLSSHAVVAHHYLVSNLS
ncbi:hypothetical protein CXB51_036028 [Gossypium anomalum]|uniref:Uncharacterized protein n=1 Tax=Gossypium anomalum TaxID=47600 RepID=A0A8J5Y327_9ROSI|nr:hypothetical protein CXB51_036028 [Gossypium anomalum]